MKTYDAIVIGAGPGGYPCAIRLGQLKQSVLCIEKESPGGVCLNWGCIPSKALINAAHTYEKVKHGGMGLKVQGVSIDPNELQDWKDGIVKKLTGGVQQLIKGNGGELMLGTAKLEPARIGPADVARLKTLSATARREWKAIADTSWDPADYGFDAARVETFRAGIAAETKALDDLDAALASGEGERIAKAAAAVKPPYARTYATFGRFPG